MKMHKTLFYICLLGASIGMFSCRPAEVTPPDGGSDAISSDTIQGENSLDTIHEKELSTAYSIIVGRWIWVETIPLNPDASSIYPQDENRYYLFSEDHSYSKLSNDSIVKQGRYDLEIQEYRDQEHLLVKWQYSDKVFYNEIKFTGDSLMYMYDGPDVVGGSTIIWKKSQ